MDTLNVWNNINERLTKFVFGKTKDKDLTKDIVQDVFVKVFSKSNTLREPNKIVSWTYQIARNEIVNHFRKAKVFPLVNDVEETVDNTNETLTSELSECLLPLINTLPEKYRQALILADIENVSQKEIAKRLNISYSGAKSRVQRGRDMLKSTLNQCCTITTDVYGDILEYKKNSCISGKPDYCKKDCD